MDSIEHKEAISPEEAVFASARSDHQKFIALAPGYDKSKWSLEDSLKEHSASCMAELQFVAAGMLSRGVVDEQDLSVVFARDHGEMENTGHVGGPKRKFAHVTLLVTTTNNHKLEMDFRAMRADDMQYDKLPDDDTSLMDERLVVTTLQDGIREYAAKVGEPDDRIPTVADLVSLYEHSENLSRLSGERADEVRFDEDF